MIGSVAFSNKMAAQQDMLRSVVGDTIANLWSGNNAQANLFQIHTLNGSQEKVVRNAFFIPVRVIWIEAICSAAAGSVACLFIGNKKLDETHVEVRTGLEGERVRQQMESVKRRKNTQDEKGGGA